MVRCGVYSQCRDWDPQGDGVRTEQNRFEEQPPVQRGHSLTLEEGVRFEIPGTQPGRNGG